MTELLKYILWPNLGTTTYDNPKVLVLLGIAAGLMVLSFIVRFWRKRVQNSVTRKLSRSWSSASFWFGFVALILAVSRVEGISYVSMRLWWIVWVVMLVVYVFFQVKLFRMRHYEKIATEVLEDPRAKYLPKRKKRK